MPRETTISATPWSTTRGFLLAGARGWDSRVRPEDPEWRSICFLLRPYPAARGMETTAERKAHVGWRLTNPPLYRNGPTGRYPPWPLDGCRGRGWLRTTMKHNGRWVRFSRNMVVFRHHIAIIFIERHMKFCSNFTSMNLVVTMNVRVERKANEDVASHKRSFVSN